MIKLLIVEVPWDHSKGIFSPSRRGFAVYDMVQTALRYKTMMHRLYGAFLVDGGRGQGGGEAISTSE